MNAVNHTEVGCDIGSSIIYAVTKTTLQITLPETLIYDVPKLSSLYTVLLPVVALPSKSLQPAFSHVPSICGVAAPKSAALFSEKSKNHNPPPNLEGIVV